MEKLIPLINKLQEVFAKTKQNFQVSLPQIVVIGGQSSGKSSVLENIVGIDFLPRGNNIVTRRPNIIQLVNAPYAEKDYAEFSHRPGEKYTDFNKVKEEIEVDTERIAGKNKDVNPTPLILKIYSKNVVDLTLVDLPGITKVPTGDQPFDIEARITDMVMKYIVPKATIIMAVTAGNIDLATSDALKLSRKVDPSGERTIGVITKLDLMDEGTDALDLLTNKIYPLKLGYVGVVCRSQKDILSGKNIQDAIKSEEKFFRQNKVYAPYQQKMGVKYLTHTLNIIIVNHIKKMLPEIRSQITGFLFQKEKEYKALSLFKEEDGKNKQQIILNAISKFTSQYAEYIEGRFVKETSTELIGGSRISYIFYDVYNKSLNSVDPFENLTDDDLKTALRNASSLRPNLFVPEVAFEVLSRQQIARLEYPSMQCVQMVFEELKRIVNGIEISEFRRFKNLRGRFVNIMYLLLNKSLQPTNKMIKDLVTIQDSYINTYHPDFMGGANAVLNVFDVQNYKDQEYKLEKLNQEQNQQQQQQQQNKNAGGGHYKKNNSLNFEDVVNKEEEKRNSSAGGLFGSWFGGNGGVGITSNVEDQQDSDEENYDITKFREDQNYEVNKYMQSNIKPLQLPQVPTSLRQAQESGQKSPRSAMEIKIIKNLITSYFNIVRKTLNDIVPKTIIAFLINKTKNNAQKELVDYILKEDNELDNLLIEDQDLVDKRENCWEMIKTLRKCQEYLNEVRDFNFREESSFQIQMR